MYKQLCVKCSGTGYIKAYSYISNGVCFKCGGVGYKMLKSKPRNSRLYKILIPMESLDGSFGVVFNTNGYSEKDALRKAKRTLARGSFANVAAQAIAEL